MKSHTIFVLEDGCYSGYHVIGVFTTRENAAIIQNLVGGSIAEWPLNPGINKLRLGYKVYCGEMQRDGSVERMIEQSIESSYDLQTTTSMWRRSQAPAYKGKGIPDCLSGSVWAKDTKHAIKIFNERRTQLIASGEWDKGE